MTEQNRKKEKFQEIRNELFVKSNENTWGKRSWLFFMFVLCVSCCSFFLNCSFHYKMKYFLCFFPVFAFSQIFYLKLESKNKIRKKEIFFLFFSAFLFLTCLIWNWKVKRKSERKKFRKNFHCFLFSCIRFSFLSYNNLKIRIFCKLKTQKI